MDKMCMRCGKQATETIEFMKDGYPVCKKCGDVIMRRFQTCMGGYKRKR